MAVSYYEVVMSGYSIALDGLHGSLDRTLASEEKTSTSRRQLGLSAELVSAIRNLVCPECGGPMGGRSKEFKCQGECGTDWRPVWERETTALRRSQHFGFPQPDAARRPSNSTFSLYFSIPG
jgi:hypothetical protein